jgi:hypothetical protein
MNIDYETDQFKECVCGHTPSKFSIGYGRTPYNFSCKCGKQLTYAKCEITGGVSNLFSYWNDKLRFSSLEELKKETEDFLKEKERVEDDNMQRAKEYRYYWFSGMGEELIERW